MSEVNALPKYLQERIVNGVTLVTKDVPAKKQIVEGLVYTGLTLLGASPKTGKTTWATDLGISVANGDTFMGNLQTDQGRVLYVSLDERQENRWQERVLRRVGGVEYMPESIDFAWEWSKLTPDNEGSERTAIDEFMDYIAYFTNLQLIIMDTLPFFLPSFTEDNKAYQIYMSLLPPLKDFAHDKDIGIIAPVHRNKQASKGGPLLDGIHGSVALTSIADNILVMDEILGSPTHQRVLHTKGKDVEELDLRLLYDRDTERTTIDTSNADELPVATPARKGAPKKEAFIRLVESNDGINANYAAEVLNVSRNAIYNYALDAKDSICSKDGVYFPKDHYLCA